MTILRPSNIMNRTGLFTYRRVTLAIVNISPCFKPLHLPCHRLNSTKSKAQTYYSLFPKTFPNGPPPSGPFKVPVNALRKEYLQLQATAHPDRLGPTATDEQRTKAENRSAQLSVAYHTLLSPLRRAQHIVACREGIADPLSEDAGRSQQEAAEARAEKEVDSSSIITDEDFLMDVLMAREAADEVSSPEELKALVEENKQRMSIIEEELDLAFKSDDLSLATELTRKLSYWAGIDRQLQDVSEQFE
ncbi:uncharacterized protein SAPINGB_P003849 [Magnusiomyces paraingens]|uniref:Co-chaperone HscB C-terminal oligomerisation domain-containing protein n=1 Tax=Magnusiomyces paraingens TaxID=2606893 RepID=A0A5E8BYW2_9ASCO|nr:uncharacterized protein SAPINGB_P003849 [Saprochaete ingens]VVT53985.1 unnamed protein product [Saprochaete ingens]